MHLACDWIQFWRPMAAKLPGAGRLADTATMVFHLLRYLAAHMEKSAPTHTQNVRREFCKQAIIYEAAGVV